VTAGGLFLVTRLVRSEGQIRPQFFIIPTIFGVLNTLWAWQRIGRPRLARAGAFVVAMSPIWLGVVWLVASVSYPLGLYSPWIGIAGGGCLVATCDALLFGLPLRRALLRAAALFIAWFIAVMTLNAVLDGDWGGELDPMGVATWQAIYLASFAALRRKAAGRA
jgi:hypothetical protein